MNAVKVRNVVIGEGMPKICVPIVGVTKEASLEEAKAFTKLPADVKLNAKEIKKNSKEFVYDEYYDKA